MRIALLHTRLRLEERMLLDACAALGVDAEPVDARSVVFGVDDPGVFAGYDLVLDRCVSLTASLTCVRILEGLGVPCVNGADAIEVCSDKLRTSISLERAGIPTPQVRVAVDPASALDAVGSVGYPAVLKPTVGSWGRLVARANDRHAAEAIIEHRATLGSAPHGVFYVQEHIDKPGRDLRVFVVGGEPICAIARRSAHWVTNTARGATTEAFAITPEIDAICRDVAGAIGADVMAIDLLEDSARGPLVNEVNHSMEFRNSVDVTGVDIPRLVIEHALRAAERAKAPLAEGAS